MISLRLFDAHGRLVRTRHDGYAPAEIHRVRWSGEDDEGPLVASGVYYAVFGSGEVRQTRRLVLLK
ncbi:MAG TPA: hypothetical protein VFP58_10685 [Candidatus Eisenbacteria bacterium]|nr:hypothetical protein [Candidatus Eisenbacteria bacterium]